MEINWLGHSCFRIKGNQAVIVTDPFPPDLGYALGNPTARIVTVSHQHPSHSHIEGVAGGPKVVAGAGDYEISGVLISGIATFHDAEDGKRLGKNTAYLIEIDGITICHLGDLGHVLTSKQEEELENADILLLPVGGVSTIDAPAAAKVVRQLEPKLVLPMHYKTPAIKRHLGSVETFLKEMGLGTVSPQPKLVVNKSNLPESTQVVLLDYFKPLFGL